MISFIGRNFTKKTADWGMQTQQIASKLSPE